MDFLELLQQFTKPSRWWRRQKTVQVTVWPRFVAQALCSHPRKQLFVIGKTNKISRCIDCYKYTEEPNDCFHGEVLESIAKTAAGGAYIRVHEYHCEHCGVKLEGEDLPSGVFVTTRGEI